MPKDRQKAIEEFLLNPDKAMFTSMEEFREAITTLLAFVQGIDLNKLEQIQGADGKSPEYGKDYFTDEDLDTFEQFIMAKMTALGKSLKASVPKMTQMEAFIKQEVAKIPTVQGKPGAKGAPGKDGSADTGGDIVQKLRALKKNKMLKITDIRGLKKNLDDKDLAIRETKESIEEVKQIAAKRTVVFGPNGGSDNGDGGNGGNVDIDDQGSMAAESIERIRFDIIETIGSAANSIMHTPDGNATTELTLIVPNANANVANATVINVYDEHSGGDFRYEGQFFVTSHVASASGNNTKIVFTGKVISEHTDLDAFSIGTVDNDVELLFRERHPVTSFISPEDKEKLDNSENVATENAKGLMSAVDKEKLDSMITYGSNTGELIRRVTLEVVETIGSAASTIEHASGNDTTTLTVVVPVAHADIGNAESVMIYDEHSGGTFNYEAQFLITGHVASAVDLDKTKVVFTGRVLDHAGDTFSLGTVGNDVRMFFVDNEPISRHLPIVNDENKVPSWDSNSRPNFRYLDREIIFWPDRGTRPIKSGTMVINSGFRAFFAKADINPGDTQYDIEPDSNNANARAAYEPTHLQDTHFYVDGNERVIVFGERNNLKQVEMEIMQVLDVNSNFARHAMFVTEHGIRFVGPSSSLNTDDAATRIQPNDSSTFNVLQWFLEIGGSESSGRTYRLGDDLVDKASLKSGLAGEIDGKMEIADLPIPLTHVHSFTFRNRSGNAYDFTANDQLFYNLTEDSDGYLNIVISQNKISPQPDFHNDLKIGAYISLDISDGEGGYDTNVYVVKDPHSTISNDEDTFESRIFRCKKLQGDITTQPSNGDPVVVRVDFGINLDFSNASTSDVPLMNTPINTDYVLGVDGAAKQVKRTRRVDLLKPVVISYTTISSLTPLPVSHDLIHISALASDLTINNPVQSDIPDWKSIQIHISGTATARTLSYGDKLIGNKPATTTVNKDLDIWLQKKRNGDYTVVYNEEP